MNFIKSILLAILLVTQSYGTEGEVNNIDPHSIEEKRKYLNGFIDRNEGYYGKALKLSSHLLKSNISSDRLLSYQTVQKTFFDVTNIPRLDIDTHILCNKILVTALNTDKTNREYVLNSLLKIINDKKGCLILYLRACDLLIATNEPDFHVMGFMAHFSAPHLPYYKRDENYFLHSYLEQYRGLLSSYTHTSYLSKELDSLNPTTQNQLCEELSKVAKNEKIDFSIRINALKILNQSKNKTILKIAYEVAKNLEEVEKNEKIRQFATKELDNSEYAEITENRKSKKLWSVAQNKGSNGTQKIDALKELVRIDSNNKETIFKKLLEIVNTDLYDDNITLENGLEASLFLIEAKAPEVQKINFKKFLAIASSPSLSEEIKSQALKIILNEQSSFVGEAVKICLEVIKSSLSPDYYYDGWPERNERRKDIIDLLMASKFPNATEIGLKACIEILGYKDIKHHHESQNWAADYLLNSSDVDYKMIGVEHYKKCIKHSDFHETFTLEAIHILSSINDKRVREQTIELCEQIALDTTHYVSIKVAEILSQSEDQQVKKKGLNACAQLFDSNPNTYWKAMDILLESKDNIFVSESIDLYYNKKFSPSLPIGKRCNNALNILENSELNYAPLHPLAIGVLRDWQIYGEYDYEIDYRVKNMLEKHKDN